MHQEGRLWEIHALHHSSTKFGFLKSIWGHPLDGLPMDLLGTLPLMCLGVNPQVLTLIAVTVALSGFLAHTSLDLRTGVLSYIFNTNEVHEVHHCNSIPGEGYNFSDITPLWDHVFGSFCLEKERIGIRSLGFVTWPKRLPKPARIRDLLLLPFHLKN